MSKRENDIKAAYENILKILDKTSVDNAFYGIIQNEYESGKMTRENAEKFYFELTGKKHI